MDIARWIWKKNVVAHLLWKLNTLIEKAKTKAKSTVKPTTATATTPRKSCRNPKNRLMYSSTRSPPSIVVGLSPNCEATSPYSVHATGQAHEYHLHHTGILCNQ